MSKQKKPISEKQLAANRANAQKSTGPRTPHRRAQSARLKDNQTFAATLSSILTIEDPLDLARRRHRLALELEPIGEQENSLTDQIALCYTRFDRLARVESGIFQSMLQSGTERVNFWLKCDQARGTPPDPRGKDLEFIDQSTNLKLAIGLQQIDAPGFALFLRYQAQAERLLRRHTAELRILQAERRELEPEPLPSGPSNEDPNPPKSILEDQPKNSPQLAPNQQPEACETKPISTPGTHPKQERGSNRSTSIPSSNSRAAPCGNSGHLRAISAYGLARGDAVQAGSTESV